MTKATDCVVSDGWVIIEYIMETHGIKYVLSY